MPNNNSVERDRQVKIYAQKWALEVLGRYEDAHPRGAEILRESLQISRIQLSNYIRFNDPLWQVLREGGKIAEHFMMYPCKQGGMFFSQLELEDRYTVVKCLYDYFKDKNAERATKRLDKYWYDTHNLMRSDSRVGESAVEQSETASSASDPQAGGLE